MKLRERLALGAESISGQSPAPDAEVTSVGQENFDWIVNAVAEMAVKLATSGENPVKEFRWAGFLAGASAEAHKPAPRKRAKA